jgi:hypothetical protein
VPRGRGTFQQADVTRALRAAKAAGLEVSGYEIEPATGKILVRIGTPDPKSKASADLDRWLATHAKTA